MMVGRASRVERSLSALLERRKAEAKAEAEARARTGEAERSDEDQREQEAAALVQRYLAVIEEAKPYFGSLGAKVVTDDEGCHIEARKWRIDVEWPHEPDDAAIVQARTYSLLRWNDPIHLIGDEVFLEEFDAALANALEWCGVKHAGG